MKGDDLDQLGFDEGTTKPLTVEKRTDWARRRTPQLPTYLLGPSESSVASETAKTRRLKAAWVRLQTQVRGCPEVGLAVRALGAVAVVDP